MIKKEIKSRIKVKLSTKKLNRGTAERPRICVYKSLDKIYLQFIDDSAQNTILAVSSLTKGVSEELTKIKGKIGKSKFVGKYAAEKAKEKNIIAGVFDRNGFRYHGRIKALVEGLKEGGLKI